jgi:hypothetical protein
MKVETKAVLKGKKEAAEKKNTILTIKINKMKQWARENGGREDILKREILKLDPDFCFDESDKFKFKREVRRRDNYSCCFCKGNILDIGLNESLHHKKPKRYGGDDSSQNQITICKHCHRLLEELIEYVEKEALESKEDSQTTRGKS